MSRFKTKQSSAYQAAVVSLKELGLDDAERAAGEALSALREKLHRELGMTKSGGIPCVGRLLRGRCQHRDLEKCLPPPGVDHDYLWRKDGKLSAYVFEPYSLNGETIKELVDYCDRNGLGMTIDARWATHFPGLTTAVILRRMGSVVAHIHTWETFDIPEKDWDQYRSKTYQQCALCGMVRGRYKADWKG